MIALLYDFGYLPKQVTVKEINLLMPKYLLHNKRRQRKNMQIYGIKRLNSAADWVSVIGEDRFKDGFSAASLAQKWHRSDLPDKIKLVFAAAAPPFPATVHVDYMIVEKPVFLDTARAPSMTDIMVYCNLSSGRPLIIAVEGKKNETFDKPINKWVEDSAHLPKPTRDARLKFLSDELGIALPTTSSIRYQLVHRTVSALLETALHGGTACVLLVHSFSEVPDANWQDYATFLAFLGIANPQKDVLQGPVKLGRSRNIDLFAAWISDSI